MSVERTHRSNLVGEGRVEVRRYRYQEIPADLRRNSTIVFPEKHAVYLVAVDKKTGALLGHRGLERRKGKDDSEDELFCSNLWVTPKNQRRGVGTELHIETARFAIEQGYKKIAFEVRQGNHRAEKTYGKAARVLSEMLNSKVALDVKEVRKGVDEVTMTLPF